MNGAHPARDTLAAYGLGKLDPLESVAVESHIAECEECCETLLDLGSDTFVERLRLAEGAEGTIGLNEASSATVCDLPDQLIKHPRYRVLELLGSGGMGNVYKAEHTLMNRTVALKVINAELVQNAQAVERFRREVQSAAQLAHSNIVTAYDAEQAGDIHFLVMEYVPGANLSDVVKRDGPLDISQTCDYVRQAAQGLHHAHEKGMVHRDVKPHNLMVTLDGQVKILDFGLATLAAAALPNEDNIAASAGDAEDGSSPTLTSAGSMMGTPDFISPEQATDARAADIRSDIYSLGCTFYHLLTGRPPFTEGSALERVRAHEETEPEAIENIRVDIPKDVGDAIRRMMSKDPAKRFQTPAEVAEALAPFVDEFRTTPTRNSVSNRGATPDERSRWLPETPNSKPFARRRNRAAVVTVILLLLVGLGLTEVTDLSAIAPTVISFVRGDGTLLIEVDDPEIEVLIDGQDVVLTGAGPKAIRLKPGQHELKATKDGQIIQTEWINISRSGKLLVRISLARENSKVETVHQAVGGAVLRRVWAGEDVDLHGSITSDGRYLSFVHWDTGNLALHDLTSGTNRLLTHNSPQSYGEANQSIFSPDDQQIAYAWFNERKQFELRIGPVDDAQHQLLYRDDGFYVWPVDWSPDGRRILVIIADDETAQIGWVSTFDGSVEILKSVDRDHAATIPKPLSLSPDGRYVAYHRSPSSDPSNRDIYLFSADGTSEVALVQHRADDRILGWAPDGSGLLFSSDRRGSEDAWFLRLTGGRPQGTPQLVKTNLGNIQPLGLAQDGSFYFGMMTGGFDVYVGTIPRGAGDATPALPRATAYFEGSNSRPMWSHDGRFLAFVSKRRSGHLLCILSLETGQQREFPLLSLVPYRSSGVCWSPDGTYILVEQVGKSGQGIYRVDTTNGKISALLASGPDARFYQPQLAPDGGTLFFVRADNAHRIMRHDLTTGEQTELHRSSPFINSLALARDGQTLAFNLGDGTKPAVLNIIPVHGGEVTTLLELKPGDGGGGLAWSPDGGHLLLERSGEEPGQNEMWRIPVKGGNAERFPVAMTRVFSLSVHPDGQRVAFHGGDLPKGEVWVMENLQLNTSP